MPPWFHQFLRTVGSLWFAAVLMALLMAAMGSATVFESTYGTEKALADFYLAPWFKLLLVLLAVNILAAVVVRYPFSKGHIGFILTHAGLLLTLGGALITQQWGMRGSVGITEGDTAREFRVSEDTLTVQRASDGVKATVDLPESVFSGFDTVHNPAIESLYVEGLDSIEVLRYLPDAVEKSEIRNDSEVPSPAVEVSLLVQGHDHPVWLFAGDTQELESVHASFRVVRDAAALDELIHPSAPAGPGGKGTVRASFSGAAFEFPIEACMAAPVPLGTTGLTLQVMQYYHHALVGENNQVINGSPNPVNPAIDFEVKGDAGEERRLAFAKHPDFKSMHGDLKGIEGLDVQFVSTVTAPPPEPIQIAVDSDGAVHVLFTVEGAPPVHHVIAPGASVETPWPGSKFTLHRYYANARHFTEVAVPEPLRQDRVPALELRLTVSGVRQNVWIQKHRPRPAHVGGLDLQLLFGEKVLPLGFEIKLNRFHLGTYPGGSQPRSFESHVTITDPAAGGKQDRLVSMNNPAKHGGYTLFQDRYYQEGGKWVTILSVSRDPGQWVAFAGYIVTTLGMLVVLGVRINRQRTMQRNKALGFAGGGR